MYEYREIEWDIDEARCASIDAVSHLLKGDARRIYRAHLLLGNAADEILEAITRVNSPQNTVDFTPYDLSIEVGPISVRALQSESPARVGWVAVGLSGDGYLYPWTLSETVRRAESSPSIRRLTDACRSAWPVDSQPPSRAVAKMRQQRRDIWPYDDCNRSSDWFWSVEET